MYFLAAAYYAWKEILKAAKKADKANQEAALRAEKFACGHCSHFGNCSCAYWSNCTTTFTTPMTTSTTSISTTTLTTTTTTTPSTTATIQTTPAASFYMEDNTFAIESFEIEFYWIIVAGFIFGIFACATILLKFIGKKNNKNIIKV